MGTAQSFDIPGYLAGSCHFDPGPSTVLLAAQLPSYLLKLQLIITFGMSATIPCPRCMPSRRYALLQMIIKLIVGPCVGA